MARSTLCCSAVQDTALVVVVNAHKPNRHPVAGSKRARDTSLIAQQVSIAHGPLVLAAGLRLPALSVAPAAGPSWCRPAKLRPQTAYEVEVPAGIEACRGRLASPRASGCRATRPVVGLLMPPLCFSVDFVLGSHWLCECRASPNALALISSRHAAPMGLVDNAGGPCVAEAASGQLTSIHRMCVDRQLVSRSGRLWLVNAASQTESDIQSNPS